MRAFLDFSILFVIRSIQAINGPASGARRESQYFQRNTSRLERRVEDHLDDAHVRTCTRKFDLNRRHPGRAGVTARRAVQRKRSKSFLVPRLEKAPGGFSAGASRTVIAYVFHTFNGPGGDRLNLSGPQRSFPQSPVPTKTLTGPL